MAQGLEPREMTPDETASEGVTRRASAQSAANVGGHTDGEQVVEQVERHAERRAVAEASRAADRRVPVGRIVHRRGDQRNVAEPQQSLEGVLDGQVEDDVHEEIRRRQREHRSSRERGRLGTLPRRLEPGIPPCVEPVAHERPVEIERRLAKVVRVVRQDGLRIEPEVEVERVSIVEALEADVRGQRQRLLHVTGTKEEIDVVHRSIVRALIVALGQDTALEDDHRDPARAERIQVRAGQRGELGLTTDRVVALLPQGRGPGLGTGTVGENRSEKWGELVARGRRDQRGEIGRRLPAPALAGGIRADQGHERRSVREVGLARYR